MSGLKFCARALCAAAVVVATGTQAVAADGWIVAGNSRVRLNWCAPTTYNSPAFAFLEMQLDAGWKTYWRMPGDAGVAPSFDWAEAGNIATATVLYPVPHRLPDQGGEAIGYKTSLVLPIRIEPADVSRPISAVTTISFGICKNICVPVELKLTGTCHGTSAADAAALDAVPRAVGQARAQDPKLAAVTGSVAAMPPRLMFDIDFGVGAEDTDLFIEAPEGLFVPLPTRAAPDAKGHAQFVVDLAKTIDAKDLLGKELRLTMAGSKGSAEAVWTAK